MKREAEKTVWRQLQEPEQEVVVGWLRWDIRCVFERERLIEFAGELEVGWEE